MEPRKAGGLRSRQGDAGAETKTELGLGGRGERPSTSLKEAHTPKVPCTSVLTPICVNVLASLPPSPLRFATPWACSKQALGGQASGAATMPTHAGCCPSSTLVDMAWEGTSWSRAPCPLQATTQCLWGCCKQYIYLAHFGN